MQSENLEKYFDSHINPNLDQELQKILWYINPEYIDAFNNFRLTVLWTLAKQNQDNFEA
jgi:hypothetical protein